MSATRPSSRDRGPDHHLMELWQFLHSLYKFLTLEWFLLNLPTATQHHIVQVLSLELMNKFLKKKCRAISLVKWYLRNVFSPGWCGSVVQCWLANQRVAGSIPSLGHMPGLQARSPVGGVQEATTHCCFSPSFSPSLPLCLKINK